VEEFEGGDARAASGGEEALAEDGLEGAGEVVEELRASFLGVEGGDAREGVDGGVCVEGREDEVAGEGEGEGGVEGFSVADFADEDAVGGLSQGVFECDVEGGAIAAYFALGDDGLLIAVEELDGIFYGEDVAWGGGIAVVEEGGEGGGFTGAGGADDEYEAAFKGSEGGERLWEAEFCEGRDDLRDVSDDGVV